jgi:hypothetical protein
MPQSLKKVIQLAAASLPPQLTSNTNQEGLPGSREGAAERGPRKQSAAALPAPLRAPVTVFGRAVRYWSADWTGNN